MWLKTRELLLYLLRVLRIACIFSGLLKSFPGITVKIWLGLKIVLPQYSMSYVLKLPTYTRQSSYECARCLKQTLLTRQRDKNNQLFADRTTIPFFLAAWGSKGCNQKVCSRRNKQGGEASWQIKVLIKAFLRRWNILGSVLVDATYLDFVFENDWYAHVS